MITFGWTSWILTVEFGCRVLMAAIYEGYRQKQQGEDPACDRRDP